ncbi:hypothetical protein U1Q18_022488 [Sarracenia purpurea var. burkii]
MAKSCVHLENKWITGSEVVQMQDVILFRLLSRTIELQGLRTSLSSTLDQKQDACLGQIPLLFCVFFLILFLLFPCCHSLISPPMISCRNVITPLYFDPVNLLHWHDYAVLFAFCAFHGVVLKQW